MGVFLFLNLLLELAMSHLNNPAGVVTVQQTKFIPPGEWHDANKFVPHLPGVYELNPISVTASSSVRRFSYFDGRGWKPAAANVGEADALKYTSTYKQVHPVARFRGLSAEV